MGVVVGEPKLLRDRKRRKDKNASFYVYWTDSVERSKEWSTSENKIGPAHKKFNLWKLRHLGVNESRSISEVLIEEIIEYYEIAQIARNKSIERLKNSKKRLLPFWGTRPASVVSALTIKDYEKHRFNQHDKLYPHGEPISINTVRRELTDLRSALSRAEKDRVINQRVFVELPTEIAVGVEHFTPHQAIGLIKMSRKIERAKDHLFIFLCIGFLTGRRKTTILELKWNDIDFGTMRIKWQAEGKAETNKKRPEGRMPKRLARILKMHRKKFPTDEYVVSYQGRAIKDIKRSFNIAVDLLREQIANDTGQPVEEVLPVAYPHMMRHSAATWRMQLGLKVEDVAEFLGMTPDTLRRRYWKHHPDFQQGPADAY